MALGALTAACSQASSTPAAKSPAEQASAAKPADQKPAESKPAPAAASPAAASKEGAKPVASGKQWGSPPAMSIDASKKYTATIKTSLGEMTAELFAKDAPNTVNNFVFLAKEGFYDGVIFHRIINGFMVQTGDPTGTGRGGPGYRFNDELTGPEGYTKGTLAMANAGPNTQGSQFFICHGPGAERLPKNYTVFGRVTGGVESLDKVAGVQVRPGPGGENSSPVEPPKIESVTIKEG
jgi:cyclophilin family peptidyl-prolyl cis-trans isomerase